MAPGSANVFPASYDLTTKVISAVVCAGMLAVVAAIHNIYIGWLPLLVVLLAYAYSPRRYLVFQQAIIVKRLIGDVRFPLTNVQELRTAGREDFRRCVRLWGSGGLFGYYGLFRTAKLGNCTWYVTNRSNTVVLNSGWKTIVFSPDDPSAFIAAVRASAPVQENPVPVPQAGVRPFGASSRIGLYAGLAIALAAVGLVVGAVIYAPGAPSYTLSRDALTIHDLFYPVTLKADALDVGQIRVVDLSRESEWRPLRRTNGFANAHYRSGWFRVANGTTVRLYEAGRLLLVLLPPKGDGAPVLVEVNDPDRFVESVKLQWSGPH